MIKPYCVVESAGMPVGYYGDGHNLAELFRNSSYNLWVPEIKVISDPELAAWYRVSYHDSDDMTVEYLEDEARICFPWPMMQNGETILYAGYPFIELLRQKNSSATIHAACIAIEDYGILFLGDVGSGKTTLSMKLCNEYGAKLFSNDLAVIGLDKEGLHCDGGTKFFHLRQESVRRSLPEFLHLFSKEERDSWSNKIIVQPSKLGLETGQGTTRIHAVYRIHVDDQKSDLHVSSADTLSTRLNFNENLTRYIRNVTTTTLGGSNYAPIGYIPSLDRPEFYEWRQRVMAHVFETMRATYLSGPTKKMLDYIVGHM